MAFNDYEQMVEELGNEQGQATRQDGLTGYDALLDQQSQQGKTTLLAAAQSPTAPDRRAEALKMSQQFKVPVDIIERNWDAFTKQRQAAELPEYERMLADTPHLTEWLTKNPEVLPAVKQDLPHMGALEFYTTAPQRAFQQAIDQQRYSDLRWRSLWQPLTPAEQGMMEGYRFAMNQGGDLGADSWWRNAVVGLGSFLGQQEPTLEGAVKGGGLGAAAGLLTAATVGPEVAVLGLTASGMAAAGAGGGILHSLLKSTFQQEAVSAYDDIAQMKDELGRPIDPTVAKWAALAVGAINAPIEAGVQEYVLSKIPGIEKLTTLQLRGAVKQALLNPSVRQAIFEAASTYGKTLAAETAQEVAQQAVTITAEEIAKASHNLQGHGTVPQRTAGQVAGELTDTATGAATQFALALLPGPLMEGGIRVRQARAGQQLLEHVGKVAEQSETVKKLPELAQAFLADATKGGATETVYADPETWNTYWQSQNEDPAKVAAILTGKPDAFDQALRTGEDLAIPMNAWAVRVAANPEHTAFWKDELRFGPDQMNAREADQWLEAQQAQRGTGAQVEEIAPPVPSAEEMVRDELAARLEAAGRTPDAAQTEAGVAAAGIAQLANIAGVSPSAFLARYGLGVTSQELTPEGGLGPVVPSRVETDSSSTGMPPSGAALAQAFNAALDRDVAQQRIRSLEQRPGPNDSRAVPFPTIDTARASQLFRSADQATAEERTIPLSDVVATQQTVSGERVGQRLDEDATPLALEHNGKFYLADGTHAATAAWARGETEIPARVVKVDDQQLQRVLEREANPRSTGILHQGAEDQTKTAAFKAWFGDWEDPNAHSTLAKGPVSSAVNADGTPQVLYHGTRGEHTTLEPGRPSKSSNVFGDYETNRHAIFLAERPEHADAFATGRGANVLPVYAQAQSTLDLTEGVPQGVVDELAATGEVSEGWLRQHLGHWSMFDDEGGQALVAALRRAGIDSVRFNDQNPETREDETTLAVLDPSQVKSALGNRGTFDANDTNILHQGPRLDHLDVAPAERKDGALLVSTRRPNPTKNTPVADAILETNLAALEKAGPEKMQQAADLFKSYQLLTPAQRRLRNTDRILRASVDAMKRNLRALWDRYPAEWRERARLWYVGANRIAREQAEKFGYTVDQTAGVLAALSPQMDWFRNVSLADRVLETVSTFDESNPTFTEREFNHFAEKAAVATETWVRQKIKGDAAAEAKYREGRALELEKVRSLIGQSWSDMDLEGQARFLRAWDELEKPRSYDVISPEGDRVGKATTKDGQIANIGWGTYAFIENAISILHDGSAENISERLGVEHKVRSFYNNISHPHDARSVTIDTHAVAAAFLEPFAGSAPEVMNTMGTKAPGEKLGPPQHAPTGISGTNAVVAQAYNELAQEVGALPREVQSVTWEAIRSLFRPEQKRSAQGRALVANIEALVRRYGRGEITHDEYVSAVFDAAGGFERPAWADVPATHEGRVAAESVLPRQSGVSVGRGDGGSDTAGSARGSADQPDGVIRGRVAAAGGRLAQPDVYHGSPHLFDRFSTDHIGTGEGAQSYGWGLYFAENPGVADSYRINNSTTDTLVDGERIDASNPLRYEAAVLISRVGYDAALQTAQERTTAQWLVPEGRAHAARLVSAIEALQGHAVTEQRAEGGLYQVHIDDAHVDNMLDWDKPLSQQPANVQAFVKARRLFDGEYGQATQYRHGHDPSGRAIYHELVSQVEQRFRRGQLKAGELAGEEGASRALAQAGIPGLRYYDALSRGMDTPRYSVANVLPDGRVVNSFSVRDQAAADRLVAQWARTMKQMAPEQRGEPRIDVEPAKENLTRNIVVFDDSIVTITHRNGQRLAQGERGFIEWGPDRKFNITLLKTADLSTFLHEVGHFFFEVAGDLVDELSQKDANQLTRPQQQLLLDYRTLLDFAGAADRKSLDVAGHEKVARAFEAYLMEGKAPSLELRSAFARMRAWFLAIYRSMKNLRVELSDDVRKVFDRFLASEDAIAAAEAQRAIAPMFTTASSAGMSEAEFALYRDQVAESSRKARERLDTELAAEVKREQTAAYKAREEEVRAEVEAQVHELPVYRALAAMRYGTRPDGGALVEGLEAKPMKLSKQAIVARYGADRLKNLPRPYIYTVDNGVDPELVAQMFGFSSGDELLGAVSTASKMEALIDERVRERMVADQSSILMDGSLLEHAEGALANEDREKIVRQELRTLFRLQRQNAPAVALERKERDYERRWFEAEARLRIAIAEGKQKAITDEKRAEIEELRKEVSRLRSQAIRGATTINRAVPDQDTIRTAAAQRLADMKIGEIKPQVFWNAALKNAQKATDFAARQLLDDAIKAKTQQLLNLTMFRMAQQVQEDVDARARFAKDLTNPATRARIAKAGDTYLDQIDGILDTYEFARVSQKTLDRRANLQKFLAALEGQGLPIPADLPIALLESAKKVNYRELPLEQFVGITDGLRTIVHLAKLKNRLLKAKDQRDFAKVRDELADSIRANGKLKPLPVEFTAREERRRSYADWFASHKKISELAQAMDGYVDGGLMWTHVILPLNRAADEEVERNNKAGAAYLAILDKHYSRKEQGRFSEALHIPAIGGALTKEGRLAVALNWGNDTSRDRITSDRRRRWSADQVQAILDTLDKRDWDFVQATWDFVDTFWPEIVEKQKRVTGVAPEKVEAVPVHTKFGTYRGGYYPLSYDSRLNARARQQEAASEAKGIMQAAYVANTTKRGHIETRVAHSDLSVRLDLGVMFQHLQQVIHDLSHHEALIDVQRLLRDASVRDAIYETKGDLVYQQFERALQDIAAGNMANAGKPTVLDKAANFARQGTQLSMLGLNLWTAAQQPLGLFNGMSRVGVSWVAKGASRWLRDASHMEATTKWINDVSPMMRNRLDTATQDLADLRQQLKRSGGWFDKLVRTVTKDHLTQSALLDGYLWHIGLMQRVADVPTWLGQYEKSKAAGETEERAIALADQAVLDSQGGGQIKDLAQVQRGGPIARLFMTFYSYGNTVFNATARAAGKTDFKNPVSVMQFMGHLGLLYAMPALFATALSRASGKSGGDDDDWLAFLEDAGRDMLSSAMNTVVLLREFQGLIAEGNRGYAGPAGTRLIQLAYDLGNQVEQGDLDAALFKAANNLAGVLFGYPAAQVQRSIDGYTALAEGRTSNPLVLLFGAPHQ